MANAVYRFIVKKTYLNLFLSLDQGEQKIKEISKFSGIDYSHLSTVLQEFQKEGLLLRDRKDTARSYAVKLTEKGEALAKVLRDVKNVVENWKEEEEIKLGTENNATTLSADEADLMEDELNDNK